MEPKGHFEFQEMAAQLKREAALLTGDRLLAAEARTEEAEARLCLTWHAIVDTVREPRRPPSGHTGEMPSRPADQRGGRPSRRERARE
ncbi:hypothetical protein [Planotetraspora mira]|uniref:Uncharacterized protein n=1 Tax=Planotetraspora mira TaxID=58121 RepID=A0A8J3TPT2_9ACTN|nr:hypothetical protein [Planotetraspora mira]GII30923.1 hypothetical protein Pmi06nite_43650 [Planotetraspora mira]